ncbi:hypothetical protein [Trebonia sp.]|uniref:hypothetical protein n=1 Tax=Trebonia sp. TaxID=2767075 RepID=UPI00261826BD|nr:hypothetical protein [Trebonia sp.]
MLLAELLTTVDGLYSGIAPAAAVPLALGDALAAGELVAGELVAAGAVLLGAVTVCVTVAAGAVDDVLLLAEHPATLTAANAAAAASIQAFALGRALILITSCLPRTACAERPGPAPAK